VSFRQACMNWACRKDTVAACACAERLLPHPDEGRHRSEARRESAPAPCPGGRACRVRSWPTPFPHDTPPFSRCPSAACDFGHHLLRDDRCTAASAELEEPRVAFPGESRV